MLYTHVYGLDHSCTNTYFILPSAFSVDQYQLCDFLHVYLLPSHDKTQTKQSTGPLKNRPAKSIPQKTPQSITDIALYCMRQLLISYPQEKLQVQFNHPRPFPMPIL